MTFVHAGYQIKTEFDPRFRENGCIPFTTEQIDAISELYLAGKTTQEIGDEYGMHASTVRNVLRRAGVEIRPRGRTRLAVPEVIADALALRAGGAEWKEIQVILGVRWEALALTVRTERAETEARIKQLEQQLVEQERRAHRAEKDVSSMRGTCAALGKIIAEQKKRAADAERGFQATQRSLSWIMHHRAVGIEGLPGWVLNNLKRILKREQEPIAPVE